MLKLRSSDRIFPGKRSVFPIVPQPCGNEKGDSHPYVNLPKQHQQRQSDAGCNVSFEVDHRAKADQQAVQAHHGRIIRNQPHAAREHILRTEQRQRKRQRQPNSQAQRQRESKRRKKSKREKRPQQPQPRSSRPNQCPAAAMSR